MLRARVATCLLPVAVCLLLVAAAGRAQAAGNPNLERARQELDELRYDDAQRSLEVALRSGDSGPEDLVEIYRLMGYVAAAKNDENAARRAFEVLLSIAPETRLPEGASPKLTEPFDAARKSTEKKGPLRCRYIIRGDGLQLIVENDPLGLVQGGLAIYDEEGLEQRVVRRGKPPFSIPVPKVAALEVRLAIIDSNGNHLVEFGNTREPLRLDIASGGGAEPGPAGPSDGSGAPAFYARWYVWGGVALLAGGVGTYFGLDVLAAQDDLEELNRQTQMEGAEIPFSRALEIQDRGERSALMANISFGVAGAAAVAAVVLYVMKPGSTKSGSDSAEPSSSSDDEDDDSAFLVPTAGPDGFGVAVFGRF
jgi:hypothetical protein